VTKGGAAKRKQWLFTNNDTNTRLGRRKNDNPGRARASSETKAVFTEKTIKPLYALYVFPHTAGETITIRCRLHRCDNGSREEFEQKPWTPASAGGRYDNVIPGVPEERQSAPGLTAPPLDEAVLS
jgi:hypothetical protein